MPDSIETLEIQLATAATDPQKIDALNALAQALHDLDPKRGLDLAQQAHTLANASQYAAGLANSLANLSRFNLILDNYILAQAHGLESLALLKALNDLPGQAKVLSTLGRTEARLANYSEALEYLFAALEIAQALGDPTEAHLLHQIASTYHHMEDNVRAVEQSRKALALDRELGNQPGVARDLNGLAVYLYNLGQYTEALACGQESLRLARAMGNPLAECYVLGTLGETYELMGEYAETIRYCSQAYEIARQLGLKLPEFAALLIMGRAYRQMQQFDLAVSCFHQALAQAEATEAKKEIFNCHRSLAEIYESQGDLAQALAHYKQFATVRETVFNEERDRKLQNLEVRHRTETARKEAEIYQLKNVALEQEIAERKRIEIELRASEERYRWLAANLQVAAQVGQVVTSILDMEQALPQVVALIHERFGYYHVGLFLLDSTATHAILHAASGPLAPAILARKPSLPVGGQSLIGRVTQTGRPFIAQDVAAEPLYSPSPTLTETRAEAVIPLLHGETILGALDIESHEVQVFSPDTIAILTTLADQIAIAVHNAQLHAAEKARAAELEQAYRALQENQAKLLSAEKMASLGRLMAGIAHEMNTLSAAARAALNELDKLVVEYQSSLRDETVMVEDHDAIAHEMRSTLKLADTAAARAVSFIQSIKTQTRDLAPQEHMRFNGMAVIEQALLFLNHALIRAHCTIEVEAGPDWIEMYGSPGRLAQVVMNLITNAIDASAPKGGGLIRLSLRQESGGVELSVSDQGTGILPEHLSKIFDPMFTTKPFGEGTGLGLMIVHEIVTVVFSGTIAVESQVGVGTTFTLHFPQTPEAPALGR